MLVAAMVFATSSIVNANNFNPSEKDTVFNSNSLADEADPCQDLVFAVISVLNDFTDMSNKELADLETEMLGNCYYEA